jgi:hypothetical protein
MLQIFRHRREAQTCRHPHWFYPAQNSQGDEGWQSAGSIFHWWTAEIRDNNEGKT